MTDVLEVVAEDSDLFRALRAFYRARELPIMSRQFSRIPKQRSYMQWRGRNLYYLEDDGIIGVMETHRHTENTGDKIDYSDIVHLATDPKRGKAIQYKKALVKAHVDQLRMEQKGDIITRRVPLSDVNEAMVFDDYFHYVHVSEGFRLYIQPLCECIRETI